jgi:hypothetical protein
VTTVANDKIPHERAINRYINRPAHVKWTELESGDSEDFWFAAFMSFVCAPFLGLAVGFVTGCIASLIRWDAETWPVEGTYAMIGFPLLFFCIAFFVSIIEVQFIYKKPKTFHSNQEHVATLYQRMTKEEQEMARPAFVSYMNALDKRDFAACSAVWDQTLEKIGERRQLHSALEGGSFDKLYEIEDYNTQLRQIVEERGNARRELEARRNHA